MASGLTNIAREIKELRRKDRHKAERRNRKLKKMLRRSAQMIDHDSDSPPDNRSGRLVLVEATDTRSTYRWVPAGEPDPPCSDRRGTPAAQQASAQPSASSTPATDAKTKLEDLLRESAARAGKAAPLSNIVPDAPLSDAGTDTVKTPEDDLVEAYYRDFHGYM